MKTPTWIGVVWLPAKECKIARSYQKLGWGNAGFFPRVFRKIMALPTPWLQASKPPDLSETKFCCFEPQFVALCYGGPRKLIKPPNSFGSNFPEIALLFTPLGGFWSVWLGRMLYQARFTHILWFTLLHSKALWNWNMGSVRSEEGGMFVG